MHRRNESEFTISTFRNLAPQFARASAPAIERILRSVCHIYCKERIPLEKIERKQNFASPLIYGKGIKDHSNYLKTKEMTFSDLR